MKFDESKHPRDEDGRFTDGSGGKSYRQNTRYEEILADDKRREAERIYNSETLRKNFKRDFVTLGKREYAELCSAIRTKYTSKIPRNGQILYGEHYYRFRYSKPTERIVCVFKLPIKGNEEIIGKRMEVANGRGKK